MQNEELIKALKEDAEWAHANEWETPITLGDHLDAAAAALEAADKQEEAQRWIPVGERLPEDDENMSFYSDGRLTVTSVLCVTHGLVSIRNRLNVKPTGTPYLDEQVTDGWVWGDGDEPTLWQPLPQPPQKGE